MRLKRGLLLLALLISLLSVTASEIYLETLDGSVISSPTDYQIIYLKDGKTLSGTVLIDDSGKIDIELLTGYKKLILSVNEKYTPGNDLYSDVTLSEQQDVLSILMFDVGSVRLMVKDKRGKSLKTPIRVDCTSNYGEQGYFDTDEFGIINLDYLPVSNCTFRSVMDDIVISKTLEITKGSMQKVILKFEDYPKKNYNLVFALIILIVLSIIYYKLKNKKPAEKKLASSGKGDIITALGYKEKEVVRFLLEQKQKSDKKDFYLSQAEIIHGTGIPKTSLVRVFDALEQKNIIQLEKIGKLKKISLTSWFESK